MRVLRSVFRIIVPLAMFLALPEIANAGCYPDPAGTIHQSACTTVNGYLNSGVPQAVDSSHALPVTASTATAGTPTDRGGTITTGGTAQTAIAANPARKNAVCQNPVSATEDLFVSLTGSATTTGSGDYADLAPGGSATILGVTDVSVNAATTGHTYLCTEWQ